MSVHRGPRIDATILGAASLLALALGGTSAASQPFAASAPPAVVSGVVASDVVGAWTSTDGTVKLQLDQDGTYVRSIEGRHKVAHGRYRIHDMSLLLRDDSGLNTTVTIYDGVLDMAGHRLQRV